MSLIKKGVKSLFIHKQIKTTSARAKAIGRFAEKLITKAKKDDVHARREIQRQLNDKDVMKIIFNDIVPKYKDQQSGYVRIVKYGIRRGDAASVSVLELV